MFRRQKAVAEAFGSHLLPRFSDCLDYDPCYLKGKGVGLEATLGNSNFCTGKGMGQEISQTLDHIPSPYLPGV